MAKIEEIVIIGGGPAGLAAAVYNSRAGLTPLMFAGAGMLKGFALTTIIGITIGVFINIIRPILF